MPAEPLDIDTQALNKAAWNAIGAMMEHHFCCGNHCNDNCAVLQLMMALAAKHRPEFLKALAEAKRDRDAYLLLLQQVYLETPNTATQNRAKNFEEYFISRGE